jgi:REP-associated tyrosine transposase
MSDHLHLILAGTDEQADFQRFMSNWKQRSGFRHKQRTGNSLWQESYYDHVLRDDEEMERAVRYVLENPVRKGLVREFDEYPFSGSNVYSAEQLKQFWQTKQG